MVIRKTKEWMHGAIRECSESIVSTVQVLVRPVQPSICPTEDKSTGDAQISLPKNLEVEGHDFLSMLSTESTG